MVCFLVRSVIGFLAMKSCENVLNFLLLLKQKLCHLFPSHILQRNLWFENCTVCTQRSSYMWHYIASHCFDPSFIRTSGSHCDFQISDCKMLFTDCLAGLREVKQTNQAKLSGLQFFKSHKQLCWAMHSPEKETRWCGDFYWGQPKCHRILYKLLSSVKQISKVQFLRHCHANLRCWNLPAVSLSLVWLFVGVRLPHLYSGKKK